MAAQFLRWCCFLSHGTSSEKAGWCFCVFSYLLSLKCFQLKIIFMPKWYGLWVGRHILISFRCYLLFFGEGLFQLTSLVAQMVKNLPAMQEDLRSSHGLGRSPGKGNVYPFFFSGEFHGQRSLKGYNSWG